MIDEFNIRLGSLADLNSIFNIEKTAFLIDSWSMKMIELEFIKKSIRYKYNKICCLLTRY